MKFAVHIVAAAAVLIELGVASEAFQFCKPSPDVPYKNPNNVTGKGDYSHNIIISWNAIPQLETNSSKLSYRVYYRQDIPDEKWTIVDVDDLKQNTLTIDKQPSYQKYRIRVATVNEEGDCHEQPEEVIGYSYEDVPLESPGNLNVIYIDVNNNKVTADIKWSPVSPASMRGELKGYKLEIWSDKDGEENRKEYKFNSTYASINNLVPVTTYYVRVRAYNEEFDGPSSKVVSFETPHNKHGAVTEFDAYPVGSTLILLKWSKPIEIHGTLDGYEIEYYIIDGYKFEEVGDLVIRDSEITSVKLVDLKENTEYWIVIQAMSGIFGGKYRYLDMVTPRSRKPDVPSFSWTTTPLDDGFSNVSIVWKQKLDGFAGNHFFVKYRLKEENIFTPTDRKDLPDKIEISGLESNRTYVMSIVAVDGDLMTESLPQEVKTNNEKRNSQTQENFTVVN